MNVTMKQVFASLFALSAVGLARGEGESYDTTDYVQTGLIAHWDAVENAGRGQQDESIASWRDLTKNHGDLVFPNGAVAGVDVHGVRYYDLKSNHYCWLSSCADIAQAVLDKSCTVEIVCDFGSQVHDTTVISLLGNTTSKRLLWVRSGGTEKIGYEGCIGTAEYLGTAYYASARIDSGYWNAARAYTFVCGRSVCAIYRNGETTEKTIAEKGLTGVDTSTVSLAFGNYRAASTVGGSYADMKIYAVRIYNRELEESEIQQNAAIDRARLFEGRFQLSQKSLTIAGDPLELGAPDPAYGVGSGMPGEATTCTAPASVETASVRFSCVGYQLYTNSVEDTLTWLPWGEGQAGTTATFTFPESDVKLAWLWEPEVKERISSVFTGCYCSGRGAVDVWYAIGDFTGIPEVRVTLKYGAEGGALDQSADGGVITPNGGVKEFPVDPLRRRGITFSGLESDRRFQGKLVFSVGEAVLSESEVFSFSTDGYLAYWPLNSRNLLEASGDVARYADQSGHGNDLTINQAHVAFVSDADSPDGECAHADGTSAYLKSTDWLQLSQAEGLTFFLRMKGCRNIDPSASTYVFELTRDFNSAPGGLLVTLEPKDGERYLQVYANSGSGLTIYRCTVPWDDSTWRNVVIAFTKQDAPDCFAVYIDGVSQTLECYKNYSASMKDAVFANQSLFIGGRGSAGTMVGDIDEFGIYGYALDADEVAQLTSDLSAKSGSLFVETVDGSVGLSHPVAGTHSGFTAGQVVSFDRNDANAASVWSLLEYDEAGDGWTVVKRGYGNVGTFMHTGGRMRLCWDVDKATIPICRWAFDDQTGRNTGIFGTDCDLEFSGNAAAVDGYLAVPKEETAFAESKNNLPLSSSEGLTVSFWARDLDKRSDVVLLELSENYNSKNGCFMLIHNKSSHRFEMAWYYGGYSYEGCKLGQSDVMMDGNWHHCTMVFRKAVWPNIDFYIDGVQMETDNGEGRTTPLAQDMTNAKFADNYKFYLCHRGSANTMKADLDNVTLYPQSLTASDVAALYAVERQEKGGAAIAVPDDAATLVVTAKKAVPTDDLPIPGFGPTCICTAGETLSFDFTRGPYTVAGSQGKYRLTGWKLYKLVNGEWTEHAKGSNPLVEFVHPGGAVRLELNFAVPGLAILFQ